MVPRVAGWPSATAGATGTVPTVVDVVLPVLDEAEALPWVLGRMPAGYHAIVVDNGSSDGSGAIALELGAEVVVEARRGFGAACWTGLRSASADVVCFMDCDGSLDPEDLHRVVAPVAAGSAQLAMGARQPERGAWPVHARLANRYLAWRVRHRFGWDVHDLGPMRAVGREPLLGLGLEDRRSGWPLEMVLLAARAGWSVAEVPVAYRPRAGRSKVTGTVRGTIEAVRDMRSILRANS